MATRSKKMDFKAIAVNALALSGGAAAAGVVDSMLLSKIGGGNLDPKIKGLIKVAAGSFVPPLIAGRGAGADFITKFGEGIVTIGGYQLLHAVLPSAIPSIAGIGNNLLAYPPQVNMSGLPTVSALPTMNGDGDDLPIVSGSNPADAFLE